MNGKVSRDTRKNVIDWLAAEGISWSGRLSEEAFLDRFVDLDKLPSTDDRYKTARQDLLQHRVNNDDWENDWVYKYSPLSLLSGSDDTFLAFLCEMLHPVVRRDVGEARALAAELNDLLRADDVELFESSMIGQRPVWSSRNAPQRGTARAVTTPATIAAEDLDRIWEPGMLRLFVSHVSDHKVAASKLKQELAIYGVSAFVAHDDIEPSLEWQAEIRSALNSMHAMAVLITEDFHGSYWTDQEVGVAMGKDVLLVPIRLPTVPYGFMARNQALPGDLTKPRELASALVDVLIKRSLTSGVMRAGLTTALEHSDSFSASKNVITKIVTTKGFTAEQVSRFEAAIRDNDQVSNYFGVVRLQRFIAAKQT